MLLLFLLLLFFESPVIAPLLVCPPMLVLHPFPLTPCPQKDVATLVPTPPDLSTPWGLKSLGLGASSHTEARPGILLLYIVRGLGPAHVCCLVGGSVSEGSKGPRLVETTCLLIVSPSTSSSSNLSLIQSQGSLTSVQWLGVSICICLSQLLVGPLGGQPC